MKNHSLAFCILAHDDPAMLRRLVEALCPHSVLIHWDKRAPALPAETLSDQDHATVLAKRMDIHWAGFGMVEATVALLEEMRNRGLADHTILLSGHCYPARPLGELADYLSCHRGMDVIQSYPIRPGSLLWNLIGRKWRMEPYLSDTLRRFAPIAAIAEFARKVRNRIARIVGRDIAKELDGAAVHHGASWWALSPASVETVLQRFRDEPQWRSAFRSCFASDELTFHSILANTDRAEKRIGPSEDKGGRSIYDAPLHHVATEPGRWLTDSVETRQATRASRKFFVRKIRSSDSGLLDWLDRRRLAA